MRLVAELLEIKEVNGGEKTDEYGFKWKKYRRVLRIVARREFNEIKNDIPENIRGKIVKQEVWRCLEPEYSWHFVTKLGQRPLLITLSEEESERVLRESSL
ncbi:MAG: hypothetical protein QXL85_08200 [Candidatus Bathyarchaeia archaeon]